MEVRQRQLLMAKSKITTTVKGGHVTRDAKTGKFLEVRTPSGVSRASAKSIRSVQEASSRRNAALKRLVNR